MRKEAEIAHVNFNFVFCVLSTNLTRALLCLPGAAAVSGQMDGQMDKGTKRGCYYSACYINLHQVIPLFTRSLAMGNRERGKKEKENGDTNTGEFCFLYAKRLLAVRQATTTTTSTTGATRTTTSSYICYISWASAENGVPLESCGISAGGFVIIIFLFLIFWFPFSVFCAFLFLEGFYFD